MFKQESTSSPRSAAPERTEEQAMCQEHEEEEVNIYCVTHSVPTCSMCKVFGAHQDREVAPLKSMYQTQKENGRRQKSQVCEKLDHLYAILEERKRDLSFKLAAEQEEKLNYFRGLTKKYKEHLERSCRTVGTGIQTME
ncbi:tripartite motif-containing protein 54 isoform X2 [Salmo trutta]|uniref:tripartite motif-containing protein 54 isoform X2 n=1 Tax=Salmo trutta TaxID=8032 RepID=UPI0011303B4C|nr:tripartite motif-containing protein 54-like isoform X2 [Salmo trutta]